MNRTLLSTLAATTISLAAQSALAADAACDRQCLKSAVDQVLDAMVKHSDTAAPLAARYRLTVNNVPSGAIMATPWRTVTAIKPMAAHQVVIDVPAQQVLFIGTVMEGASPSLMTGRLHLNDKKKVDELELYIARSKADSGMQFDPLGPANLPAEWSAPTLVAQRESREALTKAAHAIFDSRYGELAVSPDCELVENGKRVTASMTVDELKKAFPGAPSDLVERVRKFNGKPMPLGCDRVDPPQDDGARIVVDEQQGIIAGLSAITGRVYPNFLPPPGPDREFPTVYVPDSMKGDQARRTQQLKERADEDAKPVSDSLPAALAVIELERFYDKKIQGTHRFMLVMPQGSGSPWVSR